MQDESQSSNLNMIKKPESIEPGLHLPEPKVTQVRQGVYIGLWVIVFILAAVLLTAVFDRAKKPEQHEATQSTSDEKQSDNSWFYNQPDSIGEIRKGVANSAVSDKKGKQAGDSVSTAMVSEDNQNLGVVDDAAELKAAMESPIKAPISDINTANANGSLQPEPNQTDSVLAHDSSSYAGSSGLTLTPSQTARLEKLFGDKPKSSDAAQALQNLSNVSDSDYLHAILKKPVSPYTVQTGSLIPATLVNGINSELPGQLTALVSQNVYDSISGRYLLMPQGTKLILTYDTNITYGQSRIQVAVKRLILPNGDNMDLNGMPAVDASGYAGLHDEVDNHYGRIYGSGALLGAITAGLQLSQPQQGNILSAPSASQVMSGAMGQQMGDVAMSMMNKNLNIAPTLKIRPGYQFNVQVTADLIFPQPWTNH